MRILFVFKETQDEHLGAMYLSSMLKIHGHRTEVVKADLDILRRKIEGDTPAILAYSALAFYADYYINLNRLLKKDYKVFSIFGGTFPTAKPEMIEEEGVDAVCIGEGEHAFLELADGLDNNRDIKAIENLWVKSDGKIHKNRLRPLVENLDTLPFPDRNLFRNKSPFFYERISIITSRGCTCSCPYCYNSTLDRLYNDARTKYRRRSVDNVIEEIKQAREIQPVKFILFHDDIFTLFPNWLEEFSYKYKKEINIPFCCYIRIDMVDSKTVSLLKQAGCHSVSFGIESGDEFIRNNVFKRNMNRQNIILAAKMLRKYGIRLRTTNIIGAYEGSLNADLETLRLNIQCGVDLARVGMLDLYPNTDIYNTTKNVGQGWARYVDSRSPALINFLSIFSRGVSGNFQRTASAFSYPRIEFKSKLEQQMASNFYLLFPLVVSFSFLFPLFRLFIRLPRNRFYIYVNYFWITYCSYCKIYPTGWRSFFGGLRKHRQTAM